MSTVSPAQTSFLNNGQIGRTLIDNEYIGKAGSRVRIESLHMRPKTGTQERVNFYTVSTISRSGLVFVKTSDIVAEECNELSTQYDENTGLTTGDGVLGMGRAVPSISGVRFEPTYDNAPRVQFIKWPQYGHPLERDCEYLLENGWEADTSNSKGNGNWISPGNRRVVGGVIVCPLGEAVAVQAQWSACARFQKKQEAPTE